MTLRYKWYSLRYHWGDRKKLDREVKAIKHDYKSNYTRQKNARINTREKNDRLIRYYQIRNTITAFKPQV